MALVETEYSGRTLIVRLNSPPVNALSRRMREAILEVLEHAEREGAVHAVIVTGGGGLGFSAGADLRESVQITSAQQAIDTAAMEIDFCEAVCRFSKPLIAAIDRYALGGGCEFALAADWRFASSRTKLGFPEATLGGFPAGGAVPLATRILGKSKTRQLMMAAEVLMAPEALQMGLVDGVVEHGDLLARAIRAAEVFTNRAYGAIRVLKSLTADSVAEARNAIIEGMRTVYADRDIREGLQAFLEKRAPNFQPAWVGVPLRMPPSQSDVG